MDLNLIPRKIEMRARDLNDAYKKQLFSASITRWELLDALLNKNEHFKVHSTATHRALFDGSRFVCGIGHNLIIPRFTIVQYIPELHKKVDYCNAQGEYTGSELLNRDKGNGYVFMRAWPEILKRVASAGYELDISEIL